MLNRVLLVGRITSDPELRKTNSGTSVATMCIAVDNALANADGSRATCFMNVVVFNKQAENCSQHLKKGSLIAVDGKLNQRNYEDTHGNKRKVFEVVADLVKYLDKKSEDTEKSIPSEEVASKSMDELVDECDLPDDDLPF